MYKGERAVQAYITVSCCSGLILNAVVIELSFLSLFDVLMNANFPVNRTIEPRTWLDLLTCEAFVFASARMDKNILEWCGLNSGGTCGRKRKEGGTR